MEERGISERMANGGITFPERDEEAGSIPWNEHPRFKGVFLKHLIRGVNTGDKLSCHMVRIDAHCVLEEHTHENNWELHEVIEGEGVFLIDGREISYYPGRVAMIPEGVRHKVVAGGAGLVLLAKFFPALL